MGQSDAAFGKFTRQVSGIGAADLGGRRPTPDCASAWTAEERVLRAEDVRNELTKLQRPFKLRGAAIDGRLDVSHMKLGYAVHFAECYFIDGVNFDFLVAPRWRFEDCLVSRGNNTRAISGDSARIADRVGLEGCVCHGPIRLGGLGCSGLAAEGLIVTADGLNEKDPWGLSMNDASIDGDVRLVDARIAGGTSLQSTKISGQLGLTGSELGSSDASNRALSAQRCIIGESLIASPSASKPAAVFRGPVWTKGIEISGNLDLRGVTFERRDGVPDGSAVDDFNMANASVTGDLRLSNVRVPSNGIVDFRNAAVGAIRLGERPDEPRKVPRLRSLIASTSTESSDASLLTSSHASLDGFAYSSCDNVSTCESWVARASDAHRPSIWLQLAIVAEKAGEPSAALRARIRASSKAANRFEQIGLGWVRYGYRPWLVVVPLLLTALAIGFQSQHVADQDAFVPAVATFTAEPVSADSCISKETRCFEAVVYAADSVTPFSLGQVDTWRPDSSHAAGAWLAGLLIFSTVLTWALAGVLVASVAGKLKRTS